MTLKFVDYIVNSQYIVKIHYLDDKNLQKIHEHNISTVVKLIFINHVRRHCDHASNFYKVVLMSVHNGIRVARDSKDKSV